MKKDEVKFIRKGGRVIPIRVKGPSKKDQKSGIAKVGGSFGVAALGAMASRKMFNVSGDRWKTYANQSGITGAIKDIYKSQVNQMDMFKRKEAVDKIAQLKRGQRRTLKSAMRLTKSSKTLMGLTIGASSLLLGSGLTDLTPKTGKQYIDDKADEIGGLAAGAFAVAVPWAVGRFTKIKVKAKSSDRLFQAWTKKGKRMSAKSRVKRRKDIANVIMEQFKDQYGG